MKIIEDISSVQRIINRLRARGIHAELCRRTKMIARKSEVLPYETDRNLDITIYIRKGREK